MRFILFFLLTFNIYSFDAVLSIEKDVESKATLSLLEDKTTSGSSPNHSKMFKLLLTDLKMSGHFVVDTELRRAYYDDNLLPTEVHDREYIIKYSYSKSGKELKVKLIQTSDSNEIFQKSYMINVASRYPFLAHNAIVDINNALGYEDISWMKRNILFSKYTSSGKSEIWIADYTLTFSSILVRGGLNLFPKWANVAQSAFYYTSYNGNLPTLYKVDMSSGTRKKILSSQGMLVASDVTADGSRLLLTMAPNGQADIYE